MGERFDRDGIQQRISTTVPGVDQSDQVIIYVGIKGTSGDEADVVGSITLTAGPSTTREHDWDDQAPPRIKARFDAFWEGAPDTGRLRAIAERLGGDHFNFYQVIEEDSSTSAAFGQTVAAPYVDPPRGGFPASSHGGDGIWSDNIPWYHDEMLPAGEKDDPDDPVTAAGNVSADGNSINYYDDPHFDEGALPGATVRFKTWLVLVKGAEAGVGSAYRPVAFLGGFQWKVMMNCAGGRTTVILRRADTDCPGESDYERLVNQPDVPGVPRWFDTNPADLAPDPNAG